MSHRLLQIVTALAGCGCEQTVDNAVALATAVATAQTAAQVQPENCHPDPHPGQKRALTGLRASPRVSTYFDEACRQNSQTTATAAAVVPAETSGKCDRSNCSWPRLATAVRTYFKRHSAAAHVRQRDFRGNCSQACCANPARTPEVLENTCKTPRTS